MNLPKETGILCLLLTLLAPPSGSRAESSASAPIGHRVFSLIGGMGNAMGGGLGVQAEVYLFGDRLSLFGGAGHVFEGNDGDPSGAGNAAGARVFAGNAVDRGFLEFSFSTLTFDYPRNTDNISFNDSRYGPVLQFGYQHTGLDGFSLMVAGGVGYLPGRVPSYADRWTPRFTFGLGHTWR